MVHLEMEWCSAVALADGSEVTFGFSSPLVGRVPPLFPGLDSSAGFLWQVWDWTSLCLDIGPHGAGA